MRAGQISFVTPMECRDIEAVPEGQDWQMELKLDGYRVLTTNDGREVRMYSRRGNDLSTRFRKLTKLISSAKAAPFIIDGEVVALDENGQHSFSLLQHGGSSALEYFVFDVLMCDGRWVTELPLEKRRALLEARFKNLPEGIRLAPILLGDPEVVLATVQEMELEGVVFKNRRSLYQPGTRPGTWLKKKTRRTEDFIIGGYIGTGQIDELIVGKRTGDELRFVSALQAGFVPSKRREVFRAIKPLKTNICPFSNLPEPRGRSRMDREKMARVNWVRPEVTTEIAFNEWTQDGRLRHARFVRLRDDVAVC